MMMGSQIPMCRKVRSWPKLSETVFGTQIALHVSKLSTPCLHRTIEQVSRSRQPQNGDLDSVDTVWILSALLVIVICLLALGLVMMVAARLPPCQRKDHALLSVIMQ